MASDNTLLNAGSGGETFPSLADAAGLNWPVGCSAYATTIATNANVLQHVTLTTGLPVQPQTGSTWAATQSGAWTVDTELPAAAALGDATANPTVPGVGAFGMAFNGTTWDMVYNFHDVTASTAIGRTTPALVCRSILHGLSGNAFSPIQMDSLTGALLVEGSTANGSLNVGRPLLIGGYTSAAAPVDAGADGEAVQSWFLRNGSQVCNLAVGGALVTGSAGLPVAQQGTWTVGATQSGTWNIGTVTTLTGITNVVHVDDNAGSLTVDGTVAATQSGTWNVGTVTTVTGITNVVHVDDNAGSLTVDGTVAATQSGTWTVQPGNTANTTPWLVTDTPATSGGLSFSHVTSAATNNKTQVKGSAGQLYMISAQNTNAAARYLKVFNNTSAGVTMGTTSADYQFIIPGNTAGAGLVLNVDKGLAHGTGITIAITGGAALNDNTSISANEVTLTIGYK